MYKNLGTDVKLNYPWSYLEADLGGSKVGMGDT